MTAQLGTLQTAFQHKMLSGAEGILAQLKDGGPFMNVYEDGYSLRLINVLAEDFGALHSLLGDEKFEIALRAYLAENPSRRRSVRWLGEGLSAWLTDNPPWNSHKVIADMAAFEWALGLSFDCPDGDVLTVALMADLAPQQWPDLVFTAHPSLHLVDLDYDVVPFQQAVKTEQEPDGAPEPFADPVTWATWRDPEDCSVYHRRLEDNEVDVLKAVLDGAPFSAMCDMLGENSGDDEPAVLAAGLLALWVNSGWISSFAIPNAST